ncbi:hypothetical protein [Klebsiella aerogenes]|uniref:hypothetical protein n=1 Tax=Klebsiella aerogenes TaxID=548 RepID=UPI001F46BA38|nr:hypothetical protein [Klebsiella aerogenes]
MIRLNEMKRFPNGRGMGGDALILVVMFTDISVGGVYRRLITEAVMSESYHIVYL